VRSSFSHVFVRSKRIYSRKTPLGRGNIFLIGFFHYKYKKEGEKRKMRLPVLVIEAETCGEAWEKAVEDVWTKGIDAPQHYEEKPTKEATVAVNILEPLKEPRFSMKDLISVTMFRTGENYKLYKEGMYRQMQYVKDLLDGDMDFRVTEEGVESYTYHERLDQWGAQHPKHEELLIKENLPVMRFGYAKKVGEEIVVEIDNTLVIKQIDYLLKKAVEEPISRKLQITTWQPHKDLIISGAPCLQRIWFRILEDSLIMETQWRSRDLYKA